MRLSFLRYILLFCITINITKAVHAQEINYAGTIGKFNNAVTFSYSASGYLYVIDARNSEVIKLDTLGNQLKDRGGIWLERGFV